MSSKPKPLVYTTKTQALSEHIARLARKLGAGAKLPTMQQLSTELGISVMTLNRALSELEAQGVLVRKQGSGTYVAENFDVKSVGLVYDRALLGASASPFGELLLHEAEDRAARGGERFSLFLAEGGSRKRPVHDDLAAAVAERRVSGLLVMTRHQNVVDWLLQRDIPLVALSYRPVAPHRVRIWHAQTARLGALELAKRGCERLALWIPAGVGIGANSGEESFEELDEFKEALADAKLEFSAERAWNLPKLLSDAGADSGLNREQGRRAARLVFEGPRAEWPDGIVCLDDDFTRGALVEMAKMGVRAGTDVQIATHTNRGSELLYGYEDVLIRLAIDPARVAAAMFEILETLMRGDEPAQPVISIAPELMSS